MRSSRWARHSTPSEFRTRCSTTRAGGEYPTPSTVSHGQAQTRIRLERPSPPACRHGAALSLVVPSSGRRPSAARGASPGCGPWKEPSRPAHRLRLLAGALPRPGCVAPCLHAAAGPTLNRARHARRLVRRRALLLPCLSKAGGTDRCRGCARLRRRTG